MAIMTSEDGRMVVTPADALTQKRDLEDRLLAVADAELALKRLQDLRTRPWRHDARRVC